MKHGVTPKPRTVIVDISLLHASGRDIVSGIFRYIEVKSGWELKLFQGEENPLTSKKIESMIAEGAAGIIVTSAPSNELERALVAADIPIVLIGVRNRMIEAKHGGIAAIHNDNTGIGAMGADYLMKHGRFRTFGFVSAATESDWSLEREQAFSEVIARHGEQVTVFHTLSHPGDDDDKKRLAKWLSSLPTPAAIMAACDWRSVQVLETCKKLGIAVPGQISLIGVDNDEFVCSHTAPSLSSILPSHEEMGFRAAELLDRMIHGRRFAPSVTIAPKRIIERDSSAFIPPSTMLVERAVKFIAANAYDGITVTDVVRHLKVSRRLAELRFKEIEGRTMRNAIEATRLARLTRLLACTARPVATIAHECGFGNINAIGHLFKRRFGISMREYRNRHRK